MPQYCSTIELQIAGKTIDDSINSVTENLDRDVKPVKTINRQRRIRGFKRGSVTGSLDIDAEQLDEPGMPTWETLLKQGTEFQIVKVPDVGPRVTWIGVTVQNVTNANSDGDSSRKIKAMFKDRAEG